MAASITPFISTSPTVGPAAPSGLRLVVLAQNLSLPDDLVLAPDLSIYFSDIGEGTIKRLGASGAVTLVVSGLREPEGIVFLPGGSLLLAEQGKNRLLRYYPTSGVLTTFLQLVNKTGRAGLDGIAFDPASETLIVPDSPNGDLLRVALDGKNVQVIARGLARPTDAAVDRDGSILVADEFGNSIRRIRIDGTPQIVARVPMPDDVLIDQNGDIYTNSLADGAIHVIRAGDGKDHIFWPGLADPQGIAWTADRNLVVAESGRHRIVELIFR